MFTSTLVVCLLVLTVEFFRRRRNHFRFFEKRGIAGPKPHILWGHYQELKSDHVYWIDKWTAEYGKTFGVFWGDKPFLVTTDLELEKNVLIKHFTNFVNRANQFALEDAHPLAKHMVTVERGSNWKRLRSAISPAFSTSKMKDMTPLILKSVYAFEENLKASSVKQSFNVYPLLKRFGIDNIGRTIFGIDANTQANPDFKSPLLKAAFEILENFSKGWLDLLSNTFTVFSRTFSSVIYFLLANGLVPHALTDLSIEIRKVVDMRMSSPPRKDLLQSLMDAQQVDNDDSSLMGTDTADEQVKKVSKTQTVQLSPNEVVANAITMFLAGYETTSTAASLIIHCLGKYPEVQTKLREEIVEALKGKKDVTYDVAMNLDYLDRVIRETLRLLPPVTGFTTRTALNDINIDGMEVPAGMSFYFPTMKVHHDSELWADPMEFNPDRFLEKPLHQLAYQPFGDGPRNCVGMRMALLTIKLILCRIIPRFEISVKKEIEIKSVNILRQPKEVPISIKLIQQE